MPDKFTDLGKEILKERGRNVCFLTQMPPFKGVKDILTRFPECLRTYFKP